MALAIFVSASALAESPRLNVRALGNNRIALTVTPVRPESVYDIFARTNGPEGHWIRITQILGGTNGSSTISYEFQTQPDPKLSGFTLPNLSRWTLVAGFGDDSDGDGLPDTYEDLVTRTDPVSGDADDGYSDPDGDGWANLQELSNNTDPLRADRPPDPRVSVSFYSQTNSLRQGKAVLKLQNTSGVLPEYFVIDRAERTLRPPTEDPRYRRPVPFPGQRSSPTNPPPIRRPVQNGSRFRPGEPSMITGPFKTVGRVNTRPGISEYSYEETNVDTLFQPLYRVRAHFVPPLRAFLNRVDASSIRETRLAVNVNQTTNGYNLVALHPIPYARYLLLVRDRNHPRWRASGYFESGTNTNPVHFRADPKGMMIGGQRPMALSLVRFTPGLFEPEFTAGWAEDSDGDGLPDIYEVLATETDPVRSDTGDSGLLDGYKDPDRDGWSNLEEFRRRTDPSKADAAPQAVTLKNPTLMEIMRAMPVQSDLPYETRVLIRTNTAARYEPLNQPLPMLFHPMNSADRRNTRGNFDLLISRHVPNGPIQRPADWH